MKKIKVTICPPAPQDVFFQEHQFDDSLGGTNPVVYLDKVPKSRTKAPSSLVRANEVKREKLDSAEAALEGHVNKKAILKILRSGL